MRKILAFIAIASILAFSGILVRGASPQGAVGACSQSGWYVAKYGELNSASYWNPARGSYSYIYFQDNLLASADNCYMRGLSSVWTSDSFNLTGGTVRSRAGWYGGQTWGTSCSANGFHRVDCYTAIGYGNPNDGWSDNWNGAYTSVNGPFGGTYGGSLYYSSAG